MNNQTSQDLSSADEIRDQAEKTKDRVKQTAQELLHRLRGGSRDKVEEQKRVAAERFETAHTAVQDAAIRLHSDNQEFVAKRLSQLADAVGHFGSFLQNTPPEEFVAKGADTVRRHPLGAVFLTGLAVARVVRSASH